MKQSRFGRWAAAVTVMAGRDGAVWPEECRGAAGGLARRAHDPVYAEPFSLIGGIRELDDGRLIVSDALEETLYVTGSGAGRGGDHLGQRPGTRRVPTAGPPVRVAGRLDPDGRSRERASRGHRLGLRIRPHDSGRSAGSDGTADHPSGGSGRRRSPVLPAQGRRDDQPIPPTSSDGARRRVANRSRWSGSSSPT